jgi:hypothetical protein
MAIRFAEGEAKYGENNWKKGLNDRTFILDRINHAMEHLMVLRDEVTAYEESGRIDAEDNAAAVILNMIFVMGWEEHN